jgi:cytochrome c oxidase cbb3-type subunit 3
MKRPILTLSLLLFLASAGIGQAAASSTDFFADLFVRMIVTATGVVLLAAILVLYRLLMVVIRREQQRVYGEHGMLAETEPVEEQESWFSREYNRWTQAVPVEQEADVLLHHDFDGIRELDNKLPPWWVALFYVTIAFAGVYMVYYHFTDMGPSSHDEYMAEVKAGEAQAEAYLASQANAIDESNVTLLEDEASLASGKTIYLNNCAACHGQQGEGGVGPNMADDYYIHGGAVADLFKVIKYGVPEKGMISWKSQLRPKDMQQVASYMLTLRGTNPPNPKEPQGELYQPEAAPAAPEDGSSSL